MSKLTPTQAMARNQAEGGTNNKGFGKLVYTETHKKESGDHMLTFTEYKYSRPSFGTDFKPVATGTEIALPLPYDLTTNYTTQWNMPESGAWTQFVAKEGGEILKSRINAGVDMPSLSLSDVKFESLAAGLGKGASAVGTDILANNRLFQVAGQGAGIARNPFIAALFEGVQFRSFNMEFRMYPKSKAEADLIRNIIAAFKYGMHPSYQEFGGMKNALFNYPYIYKPKFTKPEYLFDFGYSIIREVTPQYHAEGAPLYIDSGGEKIPAFINLQISFMEIEIITKDSLAGTDSTLSGRFGS